MPHNRTVKVRGQDLHIIAIILARGDSDRLPRKLIRPFAGKTLLEWAIIQCQTCRYIGDIYVVTEDEEVKGISERYGARVIIESKLFSGSPGGGGTAGNWARQNIALERHVDLFLERMPVHPLLKPGDLDRQFETYWLSRSIEVGTAYRVRDVQILKETGRNTVRTCLLDFNGKYWAPAYTGHVREWRLWPTLQVYGAEQIICELESWQAADIDYEIEFEIAEILFEKKILKGNMNVYQDYAKSNKTKLHDCVKPMITYGVERNG